VAHCCDGNSNQYVLRALHTPCHFLVMDHLTMVWLCRSVAFSSGVVGTLPDSWSALTRLGKLCAPPHFLAELLNIDAHLCCPASWVRDGGATAATSAGARAGAHMPSCITCHIMYLAPLILKMPACAFASSWITSACLMSSCKRPHPGYDIACRANVAPAIDVLLSSELHHWRAQCSHILSCVPAPS
jgi:hypothetical protein